MYFAFIMIAVILIMAVYFVFAHNNTFAESAPKKENSLYMFEAREISRYPNSMRDEYVAYIKSLPYTDDEQAAHKRLEDWTSTHKNPIYYFKIAGINKRTGIKSLVGNVRILLEEEPTNKHDANAIKVIHRGTGKHLGYVKADQTDTIRSMVPSLPHETIGEIHTFYDSFEDREYLDGTFQIDTRTS